MISDWRSARLRIERVVAGGDGLARETDGRVVFVPGSLPGELVNVRVVSAKRDFARAEMIGVVERSPHRLDPPCVELPRGCGGCDWQHIEPEAQLALKVDIVRDALRRTAKLADAVVAAGGSVPPWAARTSMRFALDGTGRAGLHAVRSDRTVDVERCLVAHPRLVELLPSLRVPGGDEISLRIGISSGDRSAWWVPVDARATGLPNDVGTGPDAAVVERIAGVDLRVSAASFFQSGPDAAALLVRTVRRLAGDELDAASSVVDAYGGVGLFAACAVATDIHVTLVEGSPSACADARRNLAGRPVDVIESAVEEWGPAPADVVLADPSRRGLGAAAIERLVSTGAATMVLISCDPVAFTRDAALLSPAYRLVDSVVLDLFPNTHHVEVVSRFERRHDGLTE